RILLRLVCRSAFRTISSSLRLRPPPLPEESGDPDELIIRSLSCLFFRSLSIEYILLICISPVMSIHTTPQASCPEAVTLSDTLCVMIHGLICPASRGPDSACCLPSGVRFFCMSICYITDYTTDCGRYELLFSKKTYCRSCSALLCPAKHQ